MTIADWVAARTAGAPPALTTRVLAALASVLDDPADTVPEAALAAADAALRQLLARGGTRAAAPDLLAVDALVTYAFESACDEPDQLVERAAAAMRRVAALADEEGV